MRRYLHRRSAADDPRGVGIPPDEPTDYQTLAPPASAPVDEYSASAYPPVPPPPGAPDEGYGAPGYPTAPPVAPAKGFRFPKWAVVPIIFVLLGVGGWFMSRRPLDAPAELGGLKKSTDAEMVADAKKTQVKDNLGGKSTISAFYGEKGNALLLVAGRQKTNPDKEWEEFDALGTARQKINGVECATSAGLTVCLWSDDVSGFVFDLRPGSSIEQAAAVTREAKDALN